MWPGTPGERGAVRDHCQQSHFRLEMFVPFSDSLYRYYERRLAASLPHESLPRHIGVILDGHRRFAREEGHVNYEASYQAGMAKLEELLGWCAELRVKAVTAWVLSTENLRRPPEELEPYFEVLGALFERLPALSACIGFSLAVSGSLDLLRQNWRWQPRKRWPGPLMVGGST